MPIDPVARGLAASRVPNNPAGISSAGGALAITNKPIRTVIPFGDSITIGSSIYSNGVWQYGGSWPELASFGAGLHIIRNAGISGNTISDMSARLQADVIAYAPDMCIVAGLTNDLPNLSSNASYATALDTYESIIVRLIRANILPVVVVPPVRESAALASRNIRPHLYRLAAYYNLPLIDLYQITVDPSTGNFRSGRSGDGTHPNVVGTMDIVPIATASLQNLHPATGSDYFTAYDETTTGVFQNLIRNGAFSRAASSPTPDGWTVNATNATQSLVAATPGASTLYAVGNTSTYAKTVSGGAYALFGADIVSGFTAGDRLIFSGRIKSTGLTNGSGSGYTLSIDVTGGGGPALKAFTAFKANVDRTFSIEMTVPVGATALTPKLFVTDVGTYEVNALTLRNQTAADAIWTPGTPAP